MATIVTGSLLGPGGGYGDPTAMGPIGSIIDFAGPENKIPANWILCDGRTISSTSYPDLYALIGGTIPDLRGYTLAGLDNMGGTNAGRLNTAGSAATTLGASMGNQTHTITVAQMPNHYHQWATNYATVAGFAGGANYNQNNTPNAWANNTGGGQSHNNIQPTRVINKIIRAF